MTVSFIPYDFTLNLSKFRRELLLIGVTYYERLMVFEHLKKPIEQIFNFAVSSIEITFNNEEMVSVRLWVECPDVEILGDIIKSLLHKNPKKVERGEVIAEDKIIYKWADRTHVLGLGAKESDGKLFIYYSQKKHSFY